MSGHIIYVWDEQKGSPTNMQEAIAILKKLENIKPLIPTALDGFIKQLQHQALKIVQKNGNLANNEEFKQEFLTLKQNFNSSITTLHLPIEDNFEVMQLIVETAKQTKVVIFDDRYGLIFLPSGQILPKDRANVYLDMCLLLDKGLDKQNDLPQNEMAFAAWIEPYLNNLLLPEGFKKVAPPEKIMDGNRILIKHIYQQDIVEGHQQLHFIYIRYREDYNLPYDGGYTVAVNFNLYLPRIMDIYKACNFKITYDDNLTFSILSSNFFDHKVVPETHKKNLTIGFSNPVYNFRPLYTKAMVLERLNIYHQILESLIELSKDIAGINKIINDKKSEWWSLSNQLYENHLHAPKCLILARLTNDPNYKTLIYQLKDPRSLEKLNKEAKRRQEYNASYEHLIEYLESLIV